MKIADLTPTLALILAVLAVSGIILLAVLSKPIPDALTGLAIAAGAYYGVGSGIRGSTPRDGGGGEKP